MSQRKALYAGSFDPYTNGHRDIVLKAAALFDWVDLVIGVNIQKKRAFDAEAMKAAIEASLMAEGLDNVSVHLYDGLMAEYCRVNGIHWYVRGLRNAMDFAYEENAAAVNRLIAPEVQTVYLRSDAPAISSSMVRELMAFGQDISPYVPPGIHQMMQKSGR